MMASSPGGLRPSCSKHMPRSTPTRYQLQRESWRIAGERPAAASVI